MSMVWAVALAVAAGASFAIGAYLQQDVASKQPEDQSLSPRLLGQLARRRRWLGGISLDVVSYGFKAGALALGPLILIQPVIVSNLLIAIPLSLRRHGLPMGRREWSGCLLVAGGLAVAVWSGRPQQGNREPSLLGWAGLFAVIAVAGTVALLVGRRIGGPLAASSMAVAAALVLATQSGLMQSTVRLFEQGVGSGFTAWQPYAMAVASIGALLLVQSAYQAGPLAASMPVIDVVNPLTAIAIGTILFGETIANGTLSLLGGVGGIAAMLAGVVLLDTSPTVHRAHAQEQEDSEDTEQETTDQPTG